jgi:hypothetical protein
VLNSGTARNAVPGDATIQWDIRATRPGMLAPIRQELDAEVRGRILPALRARRVRRRGDRDRDASTTCRR